MLYNRFAFVLYGFIFFNISNHLLMLILPSSMVCWRQKWKWKNAANSLLHSLITGVGSLLCFYSHPSMAEDLISSHTEGALLLVSFSVGYFMFDFYDMAMNHRKRSSYELMGHHICVISCFGLAVVSQHYVGYAVVALLVEVNSVFLHARQLLIVSGESRSCSLYRLTALCNVGTFLVFRIAVLGWMTRWLVLHNAVLPVPVYVLGTVSMSIIVIMNIVLFVRIFMTDFMKKADKTKDGVRDGGPSSTATSNSAAAKVIFSQNTTVPEVHLD